MPTPITPLDPNSPKGRRVAAELTELLAEFRLEIADRDRKRQTAEPGRAAA